jgi:hypothetical protein
LGRGTGKLVPLPFSSCATCPASDSFLCPLFMATPSAWLPRPLGNDRGAEPDLVQELSDVVGRTESCIGGIRVLLARSRAEEPETRSLEELESERTSEKQLEVLDTLRAQAAGRVMPGPPEVGIAIVTCADRWANR